MNTKTADGKVLTHDGKTFSIEDVADCLQANAHSCLASDGWSQLDLAGWDLRMKYMKGAPKDAMPWFWILEARGSGDEADLRRFVDRLGADYAIELPPGKTPGVRGWIWSYPGDPVALPSWTDRSKIMTCKIVKLS